MKSLGPVLIAAAISAGGAEASPRPVSLEEAIASALQNSPQMVQALGQRKVASAGVRSARAAFLPSLGLSAGANRQLPSAGGRTQVEDGQVVTLPDKPWSMSMGLSANLTLFDGGRRFFDLAKANAAATTAQVNETTQRYDVILAVKQEYFNVLAARESRAAALSQVTQAEQQFRASIARVRTRTATRSDSLRSDIQLRNARLAVREAEDAMDLADASLTRIIGAPDPVTAAETDSMGPPVLALTAEELWQLVEDAPMVQRAELALESARAARRGAWTSYLPSLTAGFSRGGSASASALDLTGGDYSYSGSLRLSLSLAVFNQLQREQQVAQAQVNEQNAVADLRDARLAARESLTQLLGTYRSAGERVAAQTASLDAAEEDLRVQQQRYAVGASTILDVLTSQTQLDAAQRDLIRARYDLRVAVAGIEALLGMEL